MYLYKHFKCNFAEIGKNIKLLEVAADDIKVIRCTPNLTTLKLQSITEESVEHKYFECINELHNLSKLKLASNASLDSFIRGVLLVNVTSLNVKCQIPVETLNEVNLFSITNIEFAQDPILREMPDLKANHNFNRLLNLVLTGTDFSFKIFWMLIKNFSSVTTLHLKRCTIQDENRRLTHSRLLRVIDEFLRTENRTFEIYMLRYVIYDKF